MNIKHNTIQLSILIKKVLPRIITKTFTVCDLVKCSLSDIQS